MKMSSGTRLERWLVAGCVCLLLIVVSCSSNNTNNRDATSVESNEPLNSDCLKSPGLTAITITDIERAQVYGTTIDLIAYDAFLVPEGAFEKFKEETGISVNVLLSADTGTMVSQSILTAGDPVADVMFGIDNTFLCRALVNDIFHPFIPSTIIEIADEFKLDPHSRVTPVDYGDICLNYWKDSSNPSPTSIDDLRSSNFTSAFVAQNPETSAPGMGFLLASIAFYGEEGWEDFWLDLRNNDVVIRPGWTESYYGDFISGGGERTIVTSYSTSPVAEYVYASTPINEPPTAIITDSCFRSIEFAGILHGTDDPIAAAMLIEFLTSVSFQELIPETNFVLPVNTNAVIPDVFVKFMPEQITPVELSPEVIEENRNRWTERWTQIVLR
jgi:thiamine transport system substrate-binding protein